MSKKFKAGDQVRITNYGGKIEGINRSRIQAMIGKVYTIESVGNVYYYINSEPFRENEIELVNEETRDKPRVVSSKVLIVDKVRPQYSTYVEASKEAIEKFFFGTRIFDFYVIKDGKLIDLASGNDVFALYKSENNSDFRQQLFDVNRFSDVVILDGIEFKRGGMRVEGKTHLYHSRADQYLSDLHIKSKYSTSYWYTLEEFASMVENNTYEIKA